MKKPSSPQAGVLARYAGEPLATRLFLRARWLWTPYEEIARLVPLRGRIFDAGCGHGLLALTMALRSPARRILAVDHDDSRILAARRAGRGIRNLDIRQGDYTRLPAGTFDAMVFLDVLHYLPYDTQKKLFRNAAGRLRRGGILVFRELAQGSSFFSRWNQLHEKVMTTLGLTKAESLYLRSADGWSRMAGSAGFRVHGRPMARPPFADYLFECRKK